MSTTITFYDIPSTLANKAWSPNTLKTRYALNFKGIPYKTIWVEYLDIEPLCKEIGATPTRNKPDGRPHYTLPVIQDTSTGAVISDSTKIAEYLDATYPDTPRLMPKGTIALHRAFEETAQSLLVPALYPYCLPGTTATLNPVSAAYFRTTREALIGKTMEDMQPKGEDHVVLWQKLQDAFGKVDGWVRANGEGSNYLGGDTVCYADMWVAAYVWWIKVVRPDTWDEVKLWHGGRWATLLNNLEKYSTVEHEIPAIISDEMTL
ncbi:hypothetical protein C8R43DRAFT_977118 [Mycena crocata]|nr:hypothetical protein C8R43DRAFT_977118 [Mycena crocata]